MNLSILKQKVAQLPQEPGVYFFRGNKGEILYIGKATNLRSRVTSYFRDNVIGVAGRSEWIGSMMPLVEKIEFEQTDSVLEALILESNLIKKHQPKYNTLEKDDKSFAYFIITKEEFPRVLILRKTDLLKISNFKFKNINEFKISNSEIKDTNFKYKGILIDKYYGPYTSKHQMEIVLKIIRRIFPFHAGKQKTEKGCLDFQLGTCPGPYAGAVSKEQYKKNIDGIKMILNGKKKRLLSGLEKEMKALAKQNEFERAAEIRNKIFALQHIRDVALIAKDFETRFDLWNSGQDGLTSARIEAYDISNISGTDAVGSMVVFNGNHPDKSQYRKFKIKTVQGSNDVAMMREVLLRRFKNDWAMPALILLDGGMGHVNMAQKLLHHDLGLDVTIAGVAKGPTRKNLKLEIRNLKSDQEIQAFLDDKNLVKSIMDEAHRFAITFHRKLRGKNALK